MKETQLVLIETESKFTIRYVVEVPVDGNTLKSIKQVQDNLGNYDEFSQVHLGENVVNVTAISKTQMLEMFDRDHDYLIGWSEEQKMRNIHKLEE